MSNDVISDMTNHEARNKGLLIYAFMLAGSAIFIMPVFVLIYVIRIKDRAKGSLLETHIEWQKKVICFYIAFIFAGVVLMLSGLGAFVGWAAFAGYLLASTYGLIRIFTRKPIYGN